MRRPAIFPLLVRVSIHNCRTPWCSKRRELLLVLAKILNAESRSPVSVTHWFLSPFNQAVYVLESSPRNLASASLAIARFLSRISASCDCLSDLRRPISVSLSVLSTSFRTWARDRARPRGRRRRARLLEGNRGGLSGCQAPAVLGSQDRQRAEQSCPLGPDQHEGRAS